MRAIFSFGSRSLAAPLVAVFGNDLDCAARLALALEGYRSRKLGAVIVAALLDFAGCWQAEAWLAERGLTRQHAVDDLHYDRATLAALMLPHA